MLDDFDFFQLKEALHGDIYSTMWEQMRADARYYNLDFAQDLDIPENIKVVIPPTARVIVDTACDHIVTQFPRIKIATKKVRKDQHLRQQELTEKQRAFYNSFFYKTSNNGSALDPYEIAKKHMVLRGKAVTFTTVEDEIDPIRNWPYRVEAVDPLAIMEDPDNPDPKYVLRSRRMNVRDLVQHPLISDEAKELLEGRFRHNQIPYRQFDNVTVWEYWTPQTVQWFEDRTGTELWSFEHGWGILPFSIVYSGWGEVEGDHYYGGAPDFNSGEYPRSLAAVGLLTMLRVGGILQTEAEMATEVRKMQKDAAWTDYIVDELLEEVFAPGRGGVYRIRLQPDQDPTKLVTPIQGRPADNNLIAYQEKMQAQAYAATAPKSVQGLREPGVEAAAQHSQIVAQAKLRYGSIQKSMERLLTMDAQRAAYLHQHVLDEPLTVFSGLPKSPSEVTIKPDDWKDHYFCEVTLQLSADERNTQAMVGERLISAYGLDPVEIAEEYAGIDNPYEQKINAAAWQLLEADELKQALVTAVMDAWQKKATLILQELGIPPETVGLVPISALQQQGPPGGPPGPGGPPSQGGSQGDMMSAMKQLTSQGMGGTSSAAPEGPVDQQRQIQQALNINSGGQLPPMNPQRMAA